MIKRKKNYKVLALLLTLLAIVALTGCGGGGGGTTSTSSAGNTTGSSTIINGLASDGPIAGGNASIYSITNGQTESLLANATTASDSTFTANISAYNNPIIVQVTGSSYIDDATAKTVQMKSITLRTVVGNAAGNVNVDVNPLTEAAVKY